MSSKTQTLSEMLFDYFYKMSISYLSDVCKLRANLQKNKCIVNKIMSEKQFEDLERIYLHLYCGNEIHKLDSVLQLFLVNKSIPSKGFLNTNESYLIHSFHSIVTNQIFELYIRFQCESADDEKRELKYKVLRGWVLKKNDAKNQVLMIFFLCIFFLSFVSLKKENEIFFVKKKQEKYVKILQIFFFCFVRK